MKRDAREKGGVEREKKRGGEKERDWRGRETDRQTDREKGGEDVC